MTITKQQKGLSKFAAVGAISARLAIGGVLFDGKLACATDSFSLIEITNNNDAEAVAGNPIVIEARGLTGCKMKNNATVEEENGSLFFVSDVETKKIETRAHADQYPKYTPIFEEAEARKDNITIRVNAKYLANIAAHLATLSPEYGAIEMTISQTPHTPIVFKANGEGQSARALLMPVTR